MSYSLLEALRELNEDKINFFDIRNSKVYTDSIFNFLTTSDNLCSVLEHQSLYTQKRNAEKQKNKNSAGQWDYISSDLENKTGKKWAYCCLTFNPIKLSCSLFRPFGLEFDYDKIISYAKSNGCEVYDYDQFKVKTEVTLNDKNKLINMKTGKAYSSMDLKIAAVGKTKDGVYFINLQGWHPREISKSIYDKIVTYLKNNYSNFLLHFINNNNGIKLYDFLDMKNSSEEAIEINSTNYIKLDNKPNMKDFVNIQEIWSVCYASDCGLISYGQNSWQNGYINAIKIPSKEILDNTDILNKNDWLDTETLKELSETFNEYEIRIYVPNDKDFYFKKEFIKAVWLPEVYELRKPFMLKKIFEEFNKLDLSNIEFNDTTYNICIRNLLGNKPEIEKLINLYNTINKFKLDVKFFKYNIEGSSDEEIDKYLSNSTNISNLGRGKGINKYSEVDLHNNYSRDHNRYLIPSEKLNEMIFNAVKGHSNNKSIGKFYDKDGNPSIIYSEFKPESNLDPRPVRLGGESIIIAKDKDNNYYLKLVCKPEFNELPGGSFDKIPENENDVLDGIKIKLKMETGISEENDLYGNLSLFNKALYMYEGNPTDYIDTLTKGNEKFKYYFSCYWLAGGILRKPLNHDALDNDTKTEKNPRGELSRWFKVDNLKNDAEFKSRYWNILPLVNELIKKDISINDNSKSMEKGIKNSEHGTVRKIILDGDVLFVRILIGMDLTHENLIDFLRYLKTNNKIKNNDKIVIGKTGITVNKEPLSNKDFYLLTHNMEFRSGGRYATPKATRTKKVKLKNTPYRIDGDKAIFTIKKGKKLVEFIVDAEKAEEVSAHKWVAQEKPIYGNNLNNYFIYYSTMEDGKQKLKSLSKFLGYGLGYTHRNGNTLDFTKNNMIKIPEKQEVNN